jgi:uncharacterized OB-fold protein
MGENIFTAAAFDKAINEGKLMATVCTACGAVHLPPRAICPECRGSAVEWRELSGRGRLAAFSVIFVAPTAMLAEGYSRTNPYCAGIVKLEEGPSISAQILGVDVAHPETIAIGLPVTAVYLRRGDQAVPQTRLAFKAEEQ